MLSVKQGGIKEHFLNLSYDLTWDSQAIDKPSNHHANVQYKTTWNNSFT